MSKLFCGECRAIVDEPHTWTEPHGEQMSGCRCGNGLVEIEPCAICCDFPVEEYEEGELPNGICAACFAEGIEKHFMEYLETLDRDEQMEFYCGKVEGGYAYDAYDVYLSMKDDYAKRVTLHTHIFGAGREAKLWTSFIEARDVRDFAEWLIERAKRDEQV